MATRKRTTVFLQERVVAPGKTVFSVSVPKWVVEVLKLQRGQGLNVHLDIDRRTIELRPIAGLESPSTRNRKRLLVLR